MVRSSAVAVTLPVMVSPLRRVQSLSRRASRAATMASSYLLVPGGGISDRGKFLGCRKLVRLSVGTGEGGQHAHHQDPGRNEDFDPHVGSHLLLPLVSSPSIGHR